MAGNKNTYHGFPVGSEISPVNRQSWQHKEVESGRRRFFEPLPAAPNPWEIEGGAEQAAADRSAQVEQVSGHVAEIVGSRVMEHPDSPESQS